MAWKLLVNTALVFIIHSRSVTKYIALLTPITIRLSASCCTRPGVFKIIVHWFILGKQVRCNEHRKRSLNVTFFTFLRLGCDSKLMNESHKKVQVVVILNHGTKGPCPHTGDGDTGAQWPVVAIQRSGAALV